MDTSTSLHFELTIHSLLTWRRWTSTIFHPSLLPIIRLGRSIRRNLTPQPIRRILALVPLCPNTNYISWFLFCRWWVVEHIFSCTNFKITAKSWISRCLKFAASQWYGCGRSCWRPWRWSSRPFWRTRGGWYCSINTLLVSASGKLSYCQWWCWHRW